MIEKIKAEIKAAMITHDNEKKDTLRMVLGNAQLAAKEKKEELSDKHILDAVQKEIKQTNQALDILRQKGQTDSHFYEVNVKRLEVLSEYLPKQMSEEEIRTAVRDLISGMDKTQKGPIMKKVMGELKGKADGKTINKIVSEVLSKS